MHDRFKAHISSVLGAQKKATWFQSPQIAELPVRWTQFNYQLNIYQMEQLMALPVVVAHYMQQQTGRHVLLVWVTGMTNPVRFGSQEHEVSFNVMGFGEESQALGDSQWWSTPSVE